VSGSASRNVPLPAWGRARHPAFLTAQLTANEAAGDRWAGENAVMGRHITVGEIQRVNHLGKSTLIRSGEQLQIPVIGPSGQLLSPPTGPSGTC